MVEMEGAKMKIFQSGFIKADWNAFGKRLEILL